MAHVTFVHGILNKTASEELVQLWRRGLAEEDGFDLGTRGVTSSMVYWADVLYDKPLAESAHAESLEAAAEAGEVEAISMEWRDELGRAGGSAAAGRAPGRGSSWRPSHASSATTTSGSRTRRRPGRSPARRSSACRCPASPRSASGPTRRGERTHPSPTRK